MDQHFLFRAQAMNPPPALFGKRRPRLPLSTTPALRDFCDGDVQTNAATLGEARGGEPGIRRHSPIPRPESPAVRAQVEQLQFWLKVFSRFCHDETEENEC